MVFNKSYSIVDGGGAHTSEDSCDPQELKVCVDGIPRTAVGLPRTREELDKHCLAYQTGMSCMDTWIKRCLPTDGQEIIQQKIGGARALMTYLCTNDTALRRDILKEPSCWSLVSSDWSVMIARKSDERFATDKLNELL
ncbi:unnamed protein product [Danaus chrysippus]|uniref:(African queen) hypothetical protein n=1 Tax=Danaus chrysippus TaxID=151541 RepID=A0A8J2QHA2_9NEOP|nr:unnamed protein product [Danaus chrysippus]